MCGEKGDIKMETKQPTEREQQGMKSEQSVESEQSEDASDNTTGENVSTDKRKILERIWTFCLQHPIGVITGVGIFLGGIGTFFIGIDAMRPDTSALSLKGEDIVKFIQVVKSDEKSQVEKTLQKIEEDPKTSVLDKAIVEAYRLKQVGKIDDSIKKWRSIANIAEGSDNDLASGAWFSIGYLHSQEGEREEALSAYNNAIRLNPDFAEAYINRGVVKSKLGKHKEAIADHDIAIRLKPNFAEAYTNRGIAKANLGMILLYPTTRSDSLEPSFANAYIGAVPKKLLVNLKLF